MDKSKQKIKVAIVDDDSFFSNVLLNFLKSKHNDTLEIKIFPTGEEFLQNLHYKPEIIMLDYILDGAYPESYDGKDVLIKLKEINFTPFIIFMSNKINLNKLGKSINQYNVECISKDKYIYESINKYINYIMCDLNLKLEIDKFNLRVKRSSLILLLIILFSIIINSII